MVDEAFLEFLSKPLDFRLYVCPHLASKTQLQPITTGNRVVLQRVAGKIVTSGAIKSRSPSPVALSLDDSLQNGGDMADQVGQSIAQSRMLY